MTRKNPCPPNDNCVICQCYDCLIYIDYTIGRRGFCVDCARHVIIADNLLNRSGIKDPPAELTYSLEHRIE